jgi:uncharacterized membrane protein YbjE (DUF340 family)
MDYTPTYLIENDFSEYALYALMFLVGISISSDKNSFNILKKLSFKISLIPLTVIVGSILGALLVSFFIGITAQDSMAIGSGFGYYSLSSIYIGKIRGEELGTIALLANIFREIFTLLASPFLVKYFGKLSPIVSGGATSMDTCLPIVLKCSGKKYALISIFSGMILTILVPFIVSLILSF